MDRDGSGSLSFSELQALLVALNIVITDKVLKAKFEKFDTSKDGELSLDEFRQLFNAFNDKPGPEIDAVSDFFGMLGRSALAWRAAKSVGAPSAAGRRDTRGKSRSLCFGLQPPLVQRSVLAARLEPSCRSDCCAGPAAVHQVRS